MNNLSHGQPHEGSGGKGRPLSYKTLGPILLALLFCVLAPRQGQGQTIGPIPDGQTTFTVISSEIVIKPAPVPCGFGGPSLPHVGEFRRETRNYRLHGGGNGTVVKEWIATADVFVRCRK